MKKIPDHVAAYAAALYTAGGGSWLDIAEIVERSGLGTYDMSDIAREAIAWQRKHVHPATVRRIRRLATKDPLKAPRLEWRKRRFWAASRRGSN